MNRFRKTLKTAVGIREHRLPLAPSLHPVFPPGAHENHVRPFGGQNFSAALPCFARSPARPFIAPCPASLESPGFAIPGEPARRRRRSTGPSSCSASPLAGRSRLAFSPLTHRTFCNAPPHPARGGGTSFFITPFQSGTDTLPPCGGRGGAAANALNLHSRRRAGATKFSLPLYGGGLGWGRQRQTGCELPELIAAATVLTLTLSPSRRGRGDIIEAGA
jgi:hypothetical protein